MAPGSTSAVGAGGLLGTAAGGQQGPERQSKGDKEAWGLGWPHLGTRCSQLAAGSGRRRQAHRRAADSARGRAGDSGQETGEWPGGQGLGSARWQRAGTGLSALRGPETGARPERRAQQVRTRRRASGAPPHTRTATQQVPVCREGRAPAPREGVGKRQPPAHPARLCPRPHCHQHAAPAPPVPGQASAQNPSVRVTCVPDFPLREDSGCGADTQLLPPRTRGKELRSDSKPGFRGKGELQGSSGKGMKRNGDNHTFFPSAWSYSPEDTGGGAGGPVGPGGQSHWQNVTEPGDSGSTQQKMQHRPAGMELGAAWRAQAWGREGGSAAVGPQANVTLTCKAAHLRPLAFCSTCGGRGHSQRLQSLRAPVRRGLCRRSTRGAPRRHRFLVLAVTGRGPALRTHKCDG